MTTQHDTNSCISVESDVTLTSEINKATPHIHTKNAFQTYMFRNGQLNSCYGTSLFRRSKYYTSANKYKIRSPGEYLWHAYNTPFGESTAIPNAAQCNVKKNVTPPISSDQIIDETPDHLRKMPKNMKKYFERILKEVSIKEKKNISENKRKRTGPISNNTKDNPKGSEEYDIDSPTEWSLPESECKKYFKPADDTRIEKSKANKTLSIILPASTDNLSMNNQTHVTIPNLARKEHVRFIDKKFFQTLERIIKSNEHGMFVDDVYFVINPDVCIGDNTVENSFRHLIKEQYIEHTEIIIDKYVYYLCWSSIMNSKDMPIINKQIPLKYSTYHLPNEVLLAKYRQGLNVMKKNINDPSKTCYQKLSKILLRTRPL